MKLASLNEGRDGKLIVVSRDGQKGAAAHHLAATLQAALDNWSTVEPALRRLSDDLNAGKAQGIFNLDPTKLHSPLPRAYQWVDGSAYLHHVELVRKARGAEMPKEFLSDPLMYQGCSDSFLAPTEPIRMGSEDWGIDFESEVAVITGDVPMGATPEEAARHIRLILIVNDVSLRNLIPAELAKGFGFLQSKPSSSFAPFALTPDELGSAWKDGKVHLALRTFINGKLFGQPNAGVDMQFNFPQLIAHAAKTRRLAAGTIVGSGTISNRDRSVGSSCLAEVRMLEILDSGGSGVGKPSTPFLRFGDRVKIEMLDAEGRSLFGTIDQEVRKSTD